MSAAAIIQKAREDGLSLARIRRMARDFPAFLERFIYNDQCARFSASRFFNKNSSERPIFYILLGSRQRVHHTLEIDTRIGQDIAPDFASPC
jgi:hypothetical protein